MKNIFLSFIICFIGVVIFSSCKEEPLCVPNEQNVLECICYHLYDPVCGCDGKTYGNDCQAGCAGVTFVPGTCD